MQEHRTAAFLETRLNKLGLETLRCGGTGVFCILRNCTGPVVGYCADPDGPPAREDASRPYASTATEFPNDGTEVPVMHALRHKTRVASALAVAELLSGNVQPWAGTLVFILQPGEETADGAKAMVEDGLWDKAPKPRIIYGAYLMGAGTANIIMVPDAAMSMADSLQVMVLGHGSHCSMPEHSIDPLVFDASMVVHLQSIVSRKVASQSAAVVTVGTFKAGLKENMTLDRAVSLPCAFTDLASCPLPLAENRLKVSIEAGEKIPYERSAR